ncbi:hypothetical protein [Tenuifilum thalassicum]|uniref:DUF2378 family protein n=1 Tax=Tenuifilum thalassicum TaxID=2590900 RepID=A0A7D3XEC1_9BACT|nr:hypothetical protein [Tenuifilum thalassicum]QKG79767.1 hypothetical protein FHG85_05660 [Tenuifilum thalassicum]
MEIKGSAVKATPDFVKANHLKNYSDWLKSLPSNSRKIMEDPIYATTWYPLIESVIIPTQKAADLFFNGDYNKAAREIGRFSADIALKGIYKIFVRISSPQFVLSRASNIFSTYYNPAVIKVIESGEKKAVLQFEKFSVDEKLIMERIAGWIEHTLEITLKSPLQVTVENIINGKELTAKITAVWD